MFWTKKTDIEKLYQKFDKLIPYNANLKTVTEVTGVESESQVLNAREYLRIFIEWAKDESQK